MLQDAASVLSRLKHDHTQMMNILAALSREVDRLIATGNADFVLLTMIMDYAINYPDLYHRTEETIVLQQLKRENRLLTPSVSRLLNEHKDLQILSRRLATTIYNLRHDPNADSEPLVKLLAQCTALQQSHNERECNCFRLAEQLFTENDWHAVALDVQGIEDPVFGESVRQAYEALHDQIMRLSKARTH